MLAVLALFLDEAVVVLLAVVLLYANIRRQ